MNDILINNSNPTSDMILEVEGVTKKFGGLRALDQCTLSICEGSITGIVGPNGSGKTTLINCITGLLRTDEGKILLYGQVINRWSVHGIARSGVGRTFQTTRVFPKLTVKENLDAGAYFGGRGRTQIGLAFLDMFDLGDFSNSRAEALSYGQKKLLELAIVMVTEPRVVLLDEPASGINPSFVEILSKHIQRLKNEGRTFVIIEHNMPFVFSLCDTVVVLDQGKNIAEGPPEEIQNDDNVLRAYLGSEQSDA